MKGPMDDVIRHCQDLHEQLQKIPLLLDFSNHSLIADPTKDQRKMLDKYAAAIGVPPRIFRGYAHEQGAP